MGIGDVALWAWVAFLVSWWAAAWWVSKATQKGALGKRIAYFAGFGAGFGWLFTIGGGLRFAVPWGAQAALFALQLAAFAFAWWARLHLGRLWSGMLTLREGHRVVDTGPYALARHPIYTGFITAAWAFALLDGSWARLVGAGILTIVMTVKSGEEERWLRAELGSADYDAYAARTRMLIPLPRTGPRG